MISTSLLRKSTAMFLTAAVAMTTITACGSASDENPQTSADTTAESSKSSAASEKSADSISSAESAKIDCILR